MTLEQLKSIWRQLKGALAQIERAIADLENKPNRPAQ